MVNGAYQPTEPLDYEVSLRSLEGRPFKIVDDLGALVGDVDEQYLYRECHPGAVYVHQGRSHRVKHLDQERREVLVDRATDWVTETRAMLESSVIVTKELTERTIGTGAGKWSARLTRVNVTERYAEYRETQRPGGRLVGTFPINPPLGRERATVSLVLTLPASVSAEAAHAVEHAVLAMVPTEVMCDRGDFVGLTGSDRTIYLYDRHVDGLGFAERAYERLPAIAAAAADRIWRCVCVKGCPLCVQSAACERWNQDLDKTGASLILDAVNGLRRERPRAPAQPPAVRSSSIRDIATSVADGLVDEHRSTAAATTTTRLGKSQSWRSDEGWSTADYRAGMAVRHAAFGEGVVRSATDGTRGPEVTVEFNTSGRRRMVGGVGYLVVPAGK